MHPTLFLNLSAEGHGDSTELEELPSGTPTLGVHLDGFSDAIVDSWQTHRIRPDDAAAAIFQSRFYEAIERAYGEEFVRMRVSYQAKSTFRRYSSDSIRCPHANTLAVDGLSLGPMEVKVTLAKHFTPSLAIRQDGFLLSNTRYYNKTVALTSITKRLKSVTHLRLHTYGVDLESRLFLRLREQLERLPERQRLCPIFGGTISLNGTHAPLVLFLDCLNGKLYRCACTHVAYSAAAEEGRRDLDPTVHGSLYVEARKLLAKTGVLEGICHRCISSRDGREVANDAYGREFVAHAGAYGFLYATEDRTSLRSGTERFKCELGLSKWKSESNLFEYVLKLFPDERIEREASPSWLDRQRFDIYLPEKRLAFEYHGAQHFMPIDHFGGEQAFQRRRELDERKLELAARNGVKVLVFRHDQPMTPAIVERKIQASMR